MNVRSLPTAALPSPLPAASPRIALCVIVRDEEAMLAGCLASARAAVERMLVVDTGSRDRSREIARAHGAELIEHVWTDDFAAARNAALAHVPEGWILVLDADERLAPGAGEVLRAAARRDDLDCGLLPLSNADALDAPLADVLSGARRRGEPVLLPRFLRRTDDLAWEGIVHESVDAWVTRGKRRLAALGAPIVHYGQVPQLRAARGKDARNLRLLERRVELSPDDPAARTHLAREYERAGAAAAALAECERAWSASLAARAAGRAHDLVPLATLRAFLLLSADRLEETREVLAHALALAPGHPNLELLRAALEERSAAQASDRGARAAALARAEAALNACLAQAGRAFPCELLPGATDWAAATRLGTVQLLQGRPSAARDSFRRALAVRSAHAEAELGRLEAEIIAGDPRAALAELAARLQGLQDETPDAWVLAALATTRLGRSADALPLALEAGRRLARRAPLAAHRVLLWKELMAALRAPAAVT